MNSIETNTEDMSRILSAQRRAFERDVLGAGNRAMIKK